MSDKPKNVRLVTVRYPDGGYEAIEINAVGYLEWVAEERGGGARLPTTFDHAREVFERAGRTFDPARLPPHVKEFTGHVAHRRGQP